MKKDLFKKYVTIDAYNKEFFICENNTLKSFKNPKFHPKNFYISYLQTKDTIITTIEVSKNIPYEDLRNVVEIRAYEELDLDPAVEYKIDYHEIPTPIHEKNIKLQLFITEPQIIEEVFTDIVKKINFIDYIIPLPLLFKPLYTQELLDHAEIHLFIYFQKEDALFALYSEGSLVYAKSLKYSFNEIAQRLSELKGEPVDVNSVIQTLAKDGLKIEDLDEMQYYMQVFSEVFMHINDVLIYVKRANNIEIINKIFISSDIGYIKGIEEYSHTYLAQEAYELHFEYPCSAANGIYVNDLHFLMALCADDILHKFESYPNFTIYKRLPPLLKRPSGELIVVTLATLLLSLAYPFYNILITYKLRHDVAILKKEYPIIHTKRVSLEQKINQLKEEIANLQQQIAQQQQQLNRRKKILNQIYDKKVNYILKAKTLADLSQDLVKYKIKAISIDNNESRFDFNITSIDNKNITQFIKYIAQQKSHQYEITTQEINKTDINSTVYFSKIEVQVK